MSKASSSILLLQRANNKRERKMLSDAFKKADKNGDGKLSYEEYWHVIQKSRINITEEEFQEIMKIKDTDGDGTISIKEFLNTNPTKNKKSDLAFKLLDKDGDGWVSKAELLEASDTLTMEQVEAVFDRRDKDGDGLLSRHEFDKLFDKK